MKNPNPNFGTNPSTAHSTTLPPTDRHRPQYSVTASRYPWSTALVIFNTELSSVQITNTMEQNFLIERLILGGLPNGSISIEARMTGVHDKPRNWTLNNPRQLKLLPPSSDAHYDLVPLIRQTKRKYFPHMVSQHIPISIPLITISHLMSATFHPSITVIKEVKAHQQVNTENIERPSFALVALGSSFNHFNQFETRL